MEDREMIMFTAACFLMILYETNEDVSTVEQADLLTLQGMFLLIGAMANKDRHKDPLLNFHELIVEGKEILFKYCGQEGMAERIRSHIVMIPDTVPDKM